VESSKTLLLGEDTSLFIIAKTPPSINAVFLRKLTAPIFPKYTSSMNIAPPCFAQLSYTLIALGLGVISSMHFSQYMIPPFSA